MDATEPQMACMEVWGGSQLADHATAFGGLDVWLYSRPHGQSARGGDVVYASSCATGRITRLMVADVAGQSGRHQLVSAVVQPADGPLLFHRVGDLRDDLPQGRIDLSAGTQLLGRRVHRPHAGARSARRACRGVSMISW